MSESLTALSCADFSAALASSAPCPGGGGASALLGALGAALGAMAARLSRSRRKNESELSRLEQSISRCEAVRKDFLRQIDADAAAFAPLAEAYGLSKADPSRAAILRQASLDAARPPLAMLELGQETLTLLEELEPLVSPLLISDLGCAAAVCLAAMDCAAMNVAVNTRSLAGDADAAALERRARELLDACRPRLQALVDAVNTRLLAR